MSWMVGEEVLRELDGKTSYHAKQEMLTNNVEKEKQVTESEIDLLVN